MIGFLVSCYLTLLLVCVYYFKGCIDDKTLNTFDKGLLRTLRRKCKCKPSVALEPTTRKAVLMFSDQQLVTGTALLASGYTQLSCGLSAYHWQIVVYLAWFSSLAHLTTLTALRQFFKDNPRLRLWRAILMLLTALMLVVALLPTGSWWWHIAPGVPAICYYKEMAPQGGFAGSLNYNSGNQMLSMLVSIFGLLIGISTRLIKLSSRATASTRSWLRTKPGNYLKNFRIMPMAVLPYRIKNGSGHPYTYSLKAVQSCCL